MDEREQAIAEIVEAIRTYDRDDVSVFSLVHRARKLADLEDPPLPDEIEVLAVYSKEQIDGTPWLAVYGAGEDVDLYFEDEKVYRCKLTPLERVR